MRKAAGIILMVQGAMFLVGGVVGLIMRGGAGLPVFSIIVTIVCGGSVVAGGLFCLKRRQWGACLFSGLIVVLLYMRPVFEDLGRRRSLGPLLTGELSWLAWILFGAAVVSIIFIVRRKKEWQEISDWKKEWQ
jgi:hypothetical protein